MKKFETLDGQLAILHKRGLIINDYKKAKQYLLTNNYYTLINGYSKFFMNPSKTKYLDQANFDEITDLYYFDEEIKYSLFTAITYAENHVKSILAYHFSKAYQDKPYAYLDINNYDNSKVLELGWLISQLSRIINNQKRDKSMNSIKHYIKQHDDVPIWVLIDYLDFGEMLALIKNLPDSLKNDIARNTCSFLSCHMKLDTIFPSETMISYLNNIREVRNVSAHNNRLLGFKCKGDVRYYSCLHSKYKIAPHAKKSDVYNVFIVLQCFLSKIQYAQLHNTILKRIKHLEKKLKSTSINEILKSLGFPENWHKFTKTLPQI